MKVFKTDLSNGKFKFVCVLDPINDSTDLLHSFVEFGVWWRITIDRFYGGRWIAAGTAHGDIVSNWIPDEALFRRRGYQLAVNIQKATHEGGFVEDGVESGAGFIDPTFGDGAESFTIRAIFEGSVQQIPTRFER